MLKMCSSNPMLENLAQTTAFIQNDRSRCLHDSHLKQDENNKQIANQTIESNISPLKFPTKMNGYKRISLQVSPTLHKKFKVMANEREETMNSLINKALKEFLKLEEAELEKLRKMQERLRK